MIHESHLADPMGEDPIEYEGTYLRYRGRYDPEMNAQDEEEDRDPDGDHLIMAPVRERRRLIISGPLARPTPCAWNSTKA